MKPEEYTYDTYILIFGGLHLWVVFYLGQSQTLFFIYGIIHFGRKAGLAPVALTECATAEVSVGIVGVSVVCVGVVVVGVVVVALMQPYLIPHTDIQRGRLNSVES